MPATQKTPVVLELALAVPADALKSLAALGESQAELAGELGKVSRRP